MRIALFGKLRAGKSAVADYIADKYDCDIIEFSAGVQDVIDIIYPELKGTKNREVLISVGQHLRKLDKDVWVNVVRHKIENSNNPNILVAGVRQQNEYDMLKELGFIFIQVDASETTRIERCKANNDSFKVETLRSHTEMVMDGFKSDYLILNEYGFKELEISIRNVLAEIAGIELREAFFKDQLKRMEKGNEE